MSETLRITLSSSRRAPTVPPERCYSGTNRWRRARMLKTQIVLEVPTDKLSSLTRELRSMGAQEVVVENPSLSSMARISVTVTLTSMGGGTTEDSQQKNASRKAEQAKEAEAADDVMELE